MNSSPCQQCANIQKRIYFQVVFFNSDGRKLLKQLKTGFDNIWDWSCKAWAVLRPCMNMTFLDAVQLISIRQPRLLEMWGGHVAMWGWVERGGLSWNVTSDHLKLGGILDLRSEYGKCKDDFMNLWTQPKQWKELMRICLRIHSAQPFVCFWDYQVARHMNTRN